VTDTDQIRPPRGEARSECAHRIAELVQDQDLTIAVAESLTGGQVAAELSAAGGASRWFRGALVAYSSEVKHAVLGVPEGPVVSADAASAMARGVRALLGADLAVGVTGAGGPDPQDGREPGTVFLALDGLGDHRAVELHLPGDPPEVVAQAAAAVLDLLAQELS
jgi:nicotinamide-nucleotide amidase